MKTKDLKINFRYLGGNIACLSVDSIDGESVHNDINNEEAIIIFNSIVGEKENCQTVKTLLKGNQELKEKLDKYENPEDMTLMMMWCTEKVKDENYDLKEENQELKKHLKVPKTCNLKTLEDYKSYYEDTTREQILEDTYIEYCAYVNLAHRYSELKKQLENKYEKVGTLTSELLYEENTKLINQQKEFIKYLEEEIKRINPNDLYIGELNLRLDDIKFTQYLIYKEILQKYKSIIGVSDENNKQ